ncbi:MAG: hypothetical protein EOP30_08445 [Rhodococcus sp. (in: high G+C Gram-positive bacteria)]|nr:MAG: hypothetical protein EOP30_08445 [Rhodococcus sp. (in: high G+C Gram-positive bacteria)]
MDETLAGSARLGVRLHLPEQPTCLHRFGDPRAAPFDHQHYRVCCRADHLRFSCFSDRRSLDDNHVGDIVGVLEQVAEPLTGEQRVGITVPRSTRHLRHLAGYRLLDEPGDRRWGDRSEEIRNARNFIGIRGALGTVQIRAQDQGTFALDRPVLGNCPHNLGNALRTPRRGHHNRCRAGKIGQADDVCQTSELLLATLFRPRFPTTRNLDQRIHADLRTNVVGGREAFRHRIQRESCNAPEYQAAE